MADDVDAMGGDAGSELAQDLADLGGDEPVSGDEPGTEGDNGDNVDDESAREEGEGDKHRRLSKEEEDEEEEGEEEEPDEDTDKEEEESEEDDETKPLRIEGRPTIQQIKKIYPDIFKKIPYFREMYFADDKYRQFIGEPDQAEGIALKAGHFDKLETTLLQGDPTVLLSELRDGNIESFKKVAQNFMPNIRKLDGNLYAELTIPVIEEFLYHAQEYAKVRGDSPEGKNLLRSAQWLADFAFQNGGKIPDIKARPTTEKHPAEIELEKEREKRSQETRNNATVDVNTRIDKSLEAMVRDGLGGGLNNFAKSAVIDRTLREFIETIKQDRAFKLKVNSLWNSAKASGYSEASKAQITNAYANKARQLIKSIRAKYITEAQGGKRRIEHRESQEEETGQEKKKGQDREPLARKRNFDSHGRSGHGGGTRRGTTVLDSRKIDYSRTSDADILSDDPKRVKLKGQR